MGKTDKDFFKIFCVHFCFYAILDLTNYESRTNIIEPSKIITFPRGTKSTIAETINSLAKAAINLADAVSYGNLKYDLSKRVGKNNDGDHQKALDVFADENFMLALRNTAVRWYASEEQSDIVEINRNGSLILAIDPLDGSSNINANISVGTIFSLKSAKNVVSKQCAEEVLLSPGENQLAAGYIIYGPQTTIVLTLGEGVCEYIFDKSKRCFVLGRSDIRIPLDTEEYSINTSNSRFWSDSIQSYIDDLNLGTEGPLKKNFNMRWVASLVAEANRILNRGGVFLYPADKRNGYENGRLRMVYECSPIAFIIVQAGGGATDTKSEILSLRATQLHGRIPFVFGSLNEVNRVKLYHGQKNYKTVLSHK